MVLNMIRPFVILFSAALAVLPVCASEIEGKIDEIFRIVQAGRSPGAAVAVIRDNQVVLTRAYGMANIEGAVANSPATIFRLASITKPFTAIAVLQLMESGKLTLDDPLSKYISDYPSAATVRISHLLHHTAGIPDFTPIDEVKKRPLEFEPGTRLSYSNNGYLLLGHIIEKVSGQSWGDYLRDHIFLPLEMTHSGFDRTVILPGRATGYLLKDGAYSAIPPSDARDAYSAGGLYSTVEDMVRWTQALTTSKVLRRETIEQAWTPGLLTDGRKTVYGFGWILTTYRGLREIGHGGDITGFNSYVAHYPDERLTIVVLSNAGMRPPGPLPNAADLTHKIADLYLGDRVQQTEEPRITVPDSILDSYVGRYKVDAPKIVLRNMGSEIVITREGDHLLGDANGTKMPLEARSETGFQALGSPAQLIFVRDPDGKCRKLIVTVMGLREFRAVREDR